MTDELTIQPQKVSAMPYALGGAAAGAAVGGIASSMYKTKGAEKTYEDLVKEANENDKVELTTKKEAVDKAEKELSEAGKAVYEGKEKDALDKAVKARDDELARLTTQQKEVLEKGNVVGEFIEPNKIQKFEKISQENLPLKDAKGKKMTSKQVENMYNSSVQSYQDAVTKFDSNLGADILNKKNAALSTIDQYLGVEENLFSNKNLDEINQAFKSKTELSGSIPGFKTLKYTNVYERAIKIAANYYPEVVEADIKEDTYFNKIGKKIDPNEPMANNAFRKSKTVADKNNPGKFITEWVEYTQKDVDAYLKEKNTVIEGKRTKLADDLFNSARETLNLKYRLNNFDNDFSNACNDGAVKLSGYSNSRGKLDVSKMLSESNNSHDITYTSKKGKSITLKGFDADLYKVNEAIKDSKTTGNFTLPANLNGSYSDIAGEPEKIVERIKQRQALLKDYNAGKKTINGAIEKCKTKDMGIIQAFDAELAEARANDKGIAKARKALAEKFPKLFGGNSEKLTSEQIEKQAKEYAEKNIKASFQENVDKLKGEYEKLAAEKGKVNEGAKKAAQEALEKAKGELNSFMSDLNGAAKGLSGKTKGLIAAGAAAVGLLAGFGIANSKNTKAAEQAKQQGIIA